MTVKIKDPCYGLHAVTGQDHHEMTQDPGRSIITNCTRCKQKIRIWCHQELKFYVDEIE